MDKPWDGRFSEPTDALVERINASIHFDRRLWREDIAGSIVHATMLGRCGILDRAESMALVGGLRDVARDIEAGHFEWRTEDEDVHMAVEGALRDKIGPVAGKLHTGRSRNDQVATDVRLWLRAALAQLIDALAAVETVLARRALEHAATPMPGYTHLQRAQPVTLGHHLLAWFEALDRDVARLLDSVPRVNVLPLGAGALAATTRPIDRAWVAAQLRFDALCRNSLDAVSDRDFAVEVLAALALCQVHLSRIGEELVLWSSQEFGFVSLPDAFCTGSSMMPQKKNPDVAELLRGKSGRVTGDLVGLLMVLKGLPLAYNKDMQEDKEPLFDAVDNVLMGLQALAPMLDRTVFDADAMRRALDAGFVLATDVAEKLTALGVPFRDAHRIVGEAVAACEREGLSLDELPGDWWRTHARVDPRDLAEVLSVEQSLARRDVEGGPAPGRVRVEAERAVRRAQGRAAHAQELGERFSLDRFFAAEWQG